MSNWVSLPTCLEQPTLRRGDVRRGRPQGLWALACLLVLILLAPAAAMAAEEDQAKADELTFCYQGKLLDSRILVVDKSRQRVMLLTYLGDPVLEYEYSCATGAQEGSKLAEGDERTPVGIYFTTHRYRDNKITIFGDRAIHLNYPNAIDRVMGRQGNGIYIHGTNQVLKPRSTNGCVVMDNHELAKVSGLIREQTTPVVVVERLTVADRAKRDAACAKLKALLERPLEQESPRLPFSLSVVSNRPIPPDKLTPLAERLAYLQQADPQLKGRDFGHLLMGLGDRWVLVTNLTVIGPGGRQVDLTRRYYFLGQDPMQASLINEEWILPDLTQARMLASWAPKKPVVVAAAQPQDIPQPAVPPASPKPRATPKPTPTPPAQPAEAAKPQPRPAPDTAGTVRKVVDLWLDAWQSKNLKLYMSFYARDFTSGDLDRRAWAKQKAYLNKVYKVIQVSAKDVKVSVADGKARVKFIQHYRSDWHRDVGKKELILVHRRGKWRILSETWEKINDRSRVASSSDRSS